MTTFSDDFLRRLRAVLAKRTGEEIPDDAEVRIVPSAAGNEDDSSGLDTALTIETATWSHRFSYDEPGAWQRLLADLEAVPDETEH